MSRARRRRISAPSWAGIWLAVAALYVVTVTLQPRMFGSEHLLNLLQVASFLGLVTIGETIVILTGGLDLSVGGIITLTNIVAPVVMAGSPDRMVPAIAVCIALGVAVGVVNGLLVTRARITPLIATLAMQSILFGAALLYTNGAPSGTVPKEFFVIGQGRFLDVVPWPAIIWLTFAAAAVVLTRRTTFGRRLYGVGANPRAAHALGISVDRTLVAAYALSGFFATLAGLLLTSYIGLPAFGIGEKYLLIAVAAVAVGGTALSGGVGGVALSVGGAFFLTQLISLSNILQVGTGGQLVIQGTVIVAGAGFYQLAQRRPANRGVTESQPSTATREEGT